MVCLGVLKTLPAAQLQLHQASRCGLRAPELGWGSAEPGAGVLSLAASPQISVTAPASLNTRQSLPKLQFAVGWAPAPGVSSLAGSSPLLAVRNQGLAMATQTPWNQGALLRKAQGIQASPVPTKAAEETRAYCSQSHASSSHAPLAAFKDTQSLCEGPISFRAPYRWGWDEQRGMFREEGSLSTDPARQPDSPSPAGIAPTHGCTHTRKGQRLGDHCHLQLCFWQVPRHSSAQPSHTAVSGSPQMLRGHHILGATGHPLQRGGHNSAAYPWSRSRGPVSIAGADSAT